ncbi:uncharacterized protein [Euwallacea fornicatus]|uniref:uncharacterized protein n=1 Tax=Euwallacea fornicatus TaxID=995702 RepID=UPI00338F2E54
MLLAFIYLDVLKKKTEDRMLLFRQQCLRARTGWGVTELWASETLDLTILKSIQLFQKLFGAQLMFHLWILICWLALSYSNKLGFSKSDQVLILGCGILNLAVLLYGLTEKCLSLRGHMTSLIALINEIVEYLSASEETSAAAQNLKRSLTTLRNLIEMQRPYFSALGVFEVEHDLLLVVFIYSISCHLVMLN